MTLIEQQGKRLVRGGTPVHVGDVLISFRGERYIATGGRAPQRAGSEGHVFAVLEASTHHDNDNDTLSASFYPSVFGCIWIDARLS